MSNNIEERDLVPYKRKLSTVVNSAENLVIKTTEELTQAVDILGKIKALAKEIKDRKEEITSPLNAALKSARELFAPFESQYTEAEKIVKSKMSAFQIAEDAKAEKARVKIEEKVASGKMDFSKAVDKIENLIPEKKVEGTTSTLTWREDRKMEIVDENLIPRSYFVIDEIKLRKDVLAGVIVPGTKVVIVKTPVSKKI